MLCSFVSADTQNAVSLNDFVLSVGDTIAFMDQKHFEMRTKTRSRV